MTGSRGVSGIGDILGDAIDDGTGTTNLGFEQYLPVMVTVQVSGGAELMRNWSKISEKIKQQASEFTVKSAYALLHESQDEVPVLTGRLRDCGYVDIIETDGKRPNTFDVGYDLDRAESRGHPAADENYALQQHWDTKLEHPRGGKAHFLSDPFARYEDKYPTGLNDELIQAVALEVAALPKPGTGGPRLVKKPR